MKLLKRKNARNGIVFVFVAVLLFFTCVVWLLVFMEVKKDELSVTFLDVGQGDAVLIETAHGNQVLLDGGNGRFVLRGLGKELSFFDRTIDVVLATHPDLDHIGGLPEVFNRYKVGMYLESGIESDTQHAEELRRAVSEEDLQVLEVKRGMYITLDQATTLHVLFPDRDVSAFDPNTGSLVLKLVYKDVSFLFTGDAPAGIETHLVNQYGSALESDVLKLGHHGSKTSSTELFLGFVDPQYAVLSVGCDNSYGHPDEEVLARLTQFEIEPVSTCEEGNITFTTNGEEVFRK